MPFGEASFYSQLPLPSSSMWHSRSLHLDCDTVDTVHLYSSLALALRCHSPAGIVAFDVINDAGGRGQVIVPPFKDTDCISWRPAVQPPKHPPSLALIAGSSQSPTEQAFMLGVLTLITAQSSREGLILEISYANSAVNSCEAGWLLIHMARALHHAEIHGTLLPPSELCSGFLEEFLFHSTPFDLCDKGSLSTFVPPQLQVLHDCFAERARSDPLAVALAFVDFEGGSVHSTRTVTYAGFLMLALHLAIKVRAFPHGPDDILPIRTQDPAQLALAMLAISISGAAFAVLAHDEHEITGLGIPLCAEIRNELWTLPRNPDQRLYTDWHEAADHLSILPDTVSSATASVLPEISLSSQLLWSVVSHTQITNILRNRYSKFGRSSRAYRVLLLGSPLNYASGLYVWETFMHGATLCSVSRNQELTIPIPSLLTASQCTHLATSHHHLHKILLSMFQQCSVSEVNQASLDFAQNFRNKFCVQTVLVDRLSQTDDNVKSLDPGWRVVSYHDAASAPDIPRSLKDLKTVILHQAEDSALLSPSSILDRIAHGQVVYNVGANVVDVGSGLLVKYGPSVRLIEAKNTVYVRAHTTIPVPSIHLVFSRGPITYIVMDRIQGRNLQHSWQELGQSQRSLVMSQLRDYFHELHSVQSSSKPGPIDGSRCQGVWFTIYGTDPFKTNAELVAWLNRKLVLAKAENLVDRFCDSHPLVFTHQDVSPRNLILDDRGKLWMIDWDLAGWYPAYFDYACICADIGVPEAPVPRGWHDAVLPILPDFEREYRSLKAIKHVLELMPFA